MPLQNRSHAYTTGSAYIGGQGGQTRPTFSGQHDSRGETYAPLNDDGADRYGRFVSAFTSSTTNSGKPAAQQPGLPEPGQVVEVRGSTWAVANVQAQGLPRSPADEASPHLSHAVYLQSLDEDRLGEQLTVVWELEVGHTVTPAQGLPETVRLDEFDDPTTLAGFIDAMG